MPASQLPLPAARPHNNQQLFSDHYLDVVLPGRAQWSLLLEEAARVREVVAGLYGGFTPSANEAQTENDLVRPILLALGHDFEVQPPLKSPDSIKRPDYVFYRDAAARVANKGRQLDDGLAAQGGFAVGEAKQWDLSLDTTVKLRGVDPFSNKNPSYQIAFYMQHTGVEWGVLTNGRLWRLYHKESAHKLDRFYEVDLPALLEGEPRDFLYFLLLFRRAAFDDQPMGVGEFLRQSVDYARSVGDSLKVQVYDALLHLSQGFLDHPSNGIATDPVSLRAVYDNSLIVLYRLLFVLYAEDRDLLPVRTPGMYRDRYSLYAIKREVAHDVEGNRPMLPTSAHLWPKLRELFGIIDKGSPPLLVGTFNGGLFDPVRHPFLEQNTIGDKHLQAAIDKLARVGGKFVDYRDLSVRHLGTIYEGLLENHLEAGEGSLPQISQISQILGEPDGRVSGVGGRVSERDGDGTVGDGRLLRLVNDKGERKATGSYYTPDYIVKYIVEQTVGPVLAEAVAGRPDDSGRIEAVLGVNVLDPAMGSGHFLVEATEYIARFLVDLGVEAVEQSFPQISQITQISEGKAGEGALGFGYSRIRGGSGGAEADLAHWKRRVAQSCIYGVDLNPLAVELAKLSLWLTTVAKDRPLSFLDHHLRTGNALVGSGGQSGLVVSGHESAGSRRGPGAAGRGGRTRKEARAESTGQVSMLADDGFLTDMKLAVGNMWLIEESAARTLSDVKAQEAQYATLRESFTGKYGRFADLVTAEHFGVRVDPALWTATADYALGRTLTTLPAIEATVERAERVAEERRFFHWELEFPEVFFDRHGRPLGAEAGFDAVIGNPPYVRQEQLAPFKPYLQASYQAFHGVADLYLYFFERGLKLTRTGGRMAFISSGTFARANFATEFRKVLPTLAQMETLIDFGENQPFEGAEMVRPSIVVLRRGLHAEPFRSLFLSERVPASLEVAVAEDGIECAAAALEMPEWTFQAAAGTLLFAKILGAGRKLIDVVEGKMFYGVKTGFNDAFIVDQATRDRLVASDPANEAIMRPVVQGENLRPWYQEDQPRWLIFTRRGVNMTAYPLLLQHLEQFHDQLEPRPADWENPGTWPGRKLGSYKWYELQDSVDYYREFDGPKIFWPDICKLPRFSWDESGMYIGNTGYVISGADWALLGLLQSRVSWFAVSQLCQPLRLRAGLWQYRVLPQFISRLPVPPLTESDREVIGRQARRITEVARARYTLHDQVRHRLLTDLGTPGKGLNQKLTAWWELSFTGLRAELVKVFKREIPVGERDAWEGWLAERQGEHRERTAEIVRLETELNARVYELFGLTAEEIALVEESTKYRYGEV